MRKKFPHQPVPQLPCSLRPGGWGELSEAASAPQKAAQLAALWHQPINWSAISTARASLTNSKAKRVKINGRKPRGLFPTESWGNKWKDRAGNNMSEHSPARSATGNLSQEFCRTHPLLVPQHPTFGAPTACEWASCSWSSAALKSSSSTGNPAVQKSLSTSSLSPPGKLVRKEKERSQALPHYWPDQAGCSPCPPRPLPCCLCYLKAWMRVQAARLLWDSKAQKSPSTNPCECGNKEHQFSPCPQLHLGHKKYGGKFFAELFLEPLVRGSSFIFFFISRAEHQPTGLQKVWSQ